MIDKKIKKFLDLIAYSEGTYGRGDNGYNVLVGGTFFNGYDDHPRKAVFLEHLNIYSTAAGKYQIKEKIFDSYKLMLKLPDFSSDSQDKIAYQLVKECHAELEILAENIEEAIRLCASRWASFPGNDYDQHQEKISTLMLFWHSL